MMLDNDCAVDLSKRGGSKGKEEQDSRRFAVVTLDAGLSLLDFAFWIARRRRVLRPQHPLIDFEAAVEAFPHHRIRSSHLSRYS